MSMLQAWRALAARSSSLRAAGATANAWTAAAPSPIGAQPQQQQHSVHPPRHHAPFHASSAAAAAAAAADAGDSGSTSTSTNSSSSTIDPFTRSLQSKTEAEILALLERRLQAQQAGEEGAEEGAEAEDDEDDGDDGGEAVNPDTGEVGGPKGKEPTRFGDWERNGRAYDF